MDITSRRPPAQEPLPFDDEADHPVQFALTARAKRAVAPHDLPPLSLVGRQGSPPSVVTADAASDGLRAGKRGGGSPVLESPTDTRPSRARALRRAGRSTSAIAHQLDVDPLLVRAWIGAGPDRCVPVPPPGASGGTTADGAGEPPGRPASDEHQTAFELARAAAAETARRERLGDPAFAAGIGLLAGIVEVDAHALTIATADERVAVAALAWLREQVSVDPARIRVVLRAAPRVAGDLLIHRWAGALGLPRERVAVARWRHAPADDAVQALVRVADGAAAATVAGWRDALLHGSRRTPADMAF